MKDGNLYIKMNLRFGNVYMYNHYVCSVMVMRTVNYTLGFLCDEFENQ